MISFSVDKTLHIPSLARCNMVAILLFVTKNYVFFSYQCNLCNRSAWKRKSMLKCKYPFGDKDAFEIVFMLLKI